jgi:hypothetical protein
MRLLGVALCVQWLWLLRTDLGCAWTSLPCLSDSLTKALFDASVELQLGNSETFLFWTDAWLNSAALTDLALDLVHTVSRATKKWCTVAATLMNHAWIQDITCALTILVIV